MPSVNLQIILTLNRINGRVTSVTSGGRQRCHGMLGRGPLCSAGLRTHA